MDSNSELYFATSGIRGKANIVISPELGLRIGRAVAKWINKNSTNNFVYIGYDTRRNSHTIASTIVAGLSSSGVDSKMFSEPVPTPLVIHATVTSEANAGIMVTGSHLPRDENGIILFDTDGNYFKGILPESELHPVKWDKLGKIENTSMEFEVYREFLENICKNEDLTQLDWDILIDPVHGPMKSYLYEILIDRVNNLVQFNWDDDDNFPGRLSEPTPVNLINTSKAIQVSRSSIGIATDMDGDRVIFLTEDGKVISGDYVGAILAKKFWLENPDATIVVPINTSAIIESTAEEVGGKLVYCKVGPPSIIEAVKKARAIYAFEETGKYFFSEYGIWPDSAISVIVLFSYLIKIGKTLKEILETMPILYSLKTKVPAPRKLVNEIMLKLKNEIQENFENINAINEMDGLRVNFKDKSWILLRPSGTENCIRVFSEHTNENLNLKLNQDGVKLIESVINQL